MKKLKLILYLLIGGSVFSQNSLNKQNWYDIEVIGLLDYNVDTVNQVITIPLTIHTDNFTIGFFTKNFPQENWKSINNSNYKIATLGKITLNYDDSLKLFHKRVVVNDSTSILQNIDTTILRKQYDELFVSRKYAQWDCNETEFKECYLLFQQITWMTLIHSTFTTEEYLKMDPVIIPCMGAELGEDYLFFSSLLKL